LTVALDGADVRTFEGLATDPVMRTIKEAFHQEYGLQCGFCAPGMLITAWDLMKIPMLPRCGSQSAAISVAVPGTKGSCAPSCERQGTCGRVIGSAKSSEEENDVPVAIPLRSRIDSTMSADVVEAPSNLAFRRSAR
jgi:xanthine dehydrogenase iron-sulfur cluster and FAD-binding subunit A